MVSEALLKKQYITRKPDLSEFKGNQVYQIFHDLPYYITRKGLVIRIYKPKNTQIQTKRPLTIYTNKKTGKKLVRLSTYRPQKEYTIDYLMDYVFD